ncbi:hypothetical protein BWI93_10560 [Siphonobacter sp. BAB-5385]|uniref:HEPN domain-containing protein n=1 Tax=Siphonobacter sp. BAB-5385 TaxID=1864822 RepID=UPI000B9E41DA|nr:HEPN domain-containing protein [Siphonobacter sp. BAB-5385]OZI08187.1 hypothetical protein BWI93_10560 [Siphonobacter sp. BAB-5385]
MASLLLTKTPLQIFSKKLVSLKHLLLIIDDLNDNQNINKKSIKESHLLKSYIVLLVSYWQVFIEDLLHHCIKNICNNTVDSRLHIILKNNLKEKIKHFNTPNTDKIDLIFSSVIGIDKITLKLQDSVNNKKAINDILKIRHHIAHTGYSPETLTKEDNFAKMETLYSSARQLEELAINFTNSLSIRI